MQDKAVAKKQSKHQIRSLVLYVDLFGSRRIWSAHVGGLVDPDRSRPVPSDRLDDYRDIKRVGRTYDESYACAQCSGSSWDDLLWTARDLEGVRRS
jgi:hypothetical protein